MLEMETEVRVDPISRTHHRYETYSRIAPSAGRDIALTLDY
jgi:hypothetical protein